MSKKTEDDDRDIRPTDQKQFTDDVKELIEQIEDTRLKRMQDYETRGHLSFSLGLLSVFLGSCAFGWFFFYEIDLFKALIGLIAGFIPPYLLHQYKMRPLQDYEKEHKSVFMPALAKALGDLKYRPKGGIKAKMLGPARLLPSFDQYVAEDCFLGTYKGIKLALSEARLSHSKKKGGFVFDGIFVLLETTESRFTGQTIITADRESAKRWKDKRWGDLAPVQVANSEFKVFSDTPNEAEKFARKDMLEQLEELSAEFDNAPLSLSFYKEKYIFIMIPYEVDMFEPSNLYMPITTRENAMQCKKEVEQILAIIDLLDFYKPSSSEKYST